MMPVKQKLTKLVTATNQNKVTWKKTRPFEEHDEVHSQIEQIADSPNKDIVPDHVKAALHKLKNPYVY